MTFKKGESGNLKGRPKNSRNKMNKSMLEQLIKIAEKVQDNEEISKGKSLLEHFIERAYTNDSVLVAYLKKVIADRNYLTDRGDGSAEETKVKFDLVETPYSAREAMIKKNKPGLLNILKQFKNNKLNIDETLNQIGEELLKNK